MKYEPKQNDEVLDWIDALENLFLFNGQEDTKRIINEFLSYAINKGLIDNNKLYHPFENTISAAVEVDYPGNLEIEKRIIIFYLSS